jgi:hypothetical protein
MISYLETGTAAVIAGFGGQQAQSGPGSVLQSGTRLAGTDIRTFKIPSLSKIELENLMSLKMKLLD